MLERDPDTVRGPDIAFFSTDRYRDIADPTRYLEIPPDLAVEIVSPSDRMREVLEKAAAWVAFGARLVWIVEPRTKRMRILRADGSSAIVEPDGEVDGEDVLPGFRRPLRVFFDGESELPEL